MIIPVLSGRASHTAVAADTQSFGSFLLGGRSYLASQCREAGTWALHRPASCRSRCSPELFPCHCHCHAFAFARIFSRPFPLSPRPVPECLLSLLPAIAHRRISLRAFLSISICQASAHRHPIHYQTVVSYEVPPRAGIHLRYGAAGKPRRRGRASASIPRRRKRDDTSCRVSRRHRDSRDIRSRARHPTRALLRQ